jgi:cell wall-associated NlpC family hydrolase
MMQAFSRLQPNAPPLAVTVEPMQDDFNYAAYTSHGAQVWPQSYLGDMTPADPQAVVDRVASNGVPRELIVPVLGPKQLDGYAGPHNIYTADDIQGNNPSPPPSTVQHQQQAPVTSDQPTPRRAPGAPSAHATPPAPNGQATTPAVSPGTVEDSSRSPPPAQIVDQAAAVQPPPAAALQPQLSTNPDDWTGNLDDEDAGDDEADGSDENEPDENEPDEGVGSDSGDDGGSDGSDGDQDAPGEGSNGEDANDPSSDGQDSSGSGSDTSGSSDSSGDSSSSGSDSSSSGTAGNTPDLGAVDAAYPGDSAPREQIAAWMASAAQKRGLPPELPVMAALTESSLRNLNYGDADSVGFFQMRTSVWDQGAYKGYARNPQRQLQWFLDRAEAVKKQRLARGLPVDDPKQYGNWVADVENPAAQYRGRYQGRLAEARALLASSDKKGSRGGGADAVQVVDAAGSAAAGPHALVALAEAKKFLGTPYKWGGSSPSTGFDCSGLVQWAYAHAGIRIPRVTDQQILAPGGVTVDRKHLVPGDLVFFRDSTGYVHHVGISLGGDKFIHAPHTGDVVKVSSLKETYYAQQFTGGRRFDAAVSGSSRALAGSSAVPSGQDAQHEAVRIAQAALDKDAAELQRPGSALGAALERQERRNEDALNAVQFLRAVDPSLVKGSGG